MTKINKAKEPARFSNEDAAKRSASRSKQAKTEASSAKSDAGKHAAKPRLIRKIVGEPKLSSLARELNTTVDSTANSKAGYDHAKTGAMPPNTRKVIVEQKPTTEMPALNAATPVATIASNGPGAPKTTKQEQVLTLLSQKGGTTIDEVVKATGWQQHSVRGFFAGTVRKKLGFDLTSEKSEGDDRRYAIKVAA
jgi:hypothetical protein